jgi:hypothetical protein
MFARDTSKGVGSEARGEGRERGYLSRTAAKPPVAQRAGGIYKSDYPSPAPLSMMDTCRLDKVVPVRMTEKRKHCDAARAQSTALVAQQGQPRFPIQPQFQQAQAHVLLPQAQTQGLFSQQAQPPLVSRSELMAIVKEVLQPLVSASTQDGKPDAQQLITVFDSPKEGMAKPAFFGKFTRVDAREPRPHGADNSADAGGADAGGADAAAGTNVVDDPVKATVGNKKARLSVREAMLAVEASMGNGRAAPNMKRPAAATPSTMRRPAAAVQGRIILEKSRSQVKAWTGIKGKGQYALFRYKNAGEIEECRRKAAKWLAS